MPVWIGADSGRLQVDGTELSNADDDTRARLRRQRLGFVFQAFHVLPHLSVAENVALLAAAGPTRRAMRVAALLDAVGLAGLGGRQPAQLSGGQLQAIARAVVHQPGLILADNPRQPRSRVYCRAGAGPCCTTRCTQAGAACLLVTHSAAAARADRVLRATTAGIFPAD